MRVQKGITLIALIITIIILLILAVVTIGAIKNSNIITYAQNASSDYNKKKTEEESTISGYESLIEESIDSGTEIGKATVGTKVTKNSTINGEVYSSTNPIIPVGYAPINIKGEYASSWTAEDGPEVSKGLVITDDTAARDDNGNTVGNEFVWIPVSETEFSSFAVLQSEGSTDYRGVLYKWSSNSTYSWSSTSTSHREPANLTNIQTFSSETTLTNGETVEAGTSYTYDGQDMFNLFDMGEYSATYYQDKFDDMVASVAKYGGFYVGRYETSLRGSVAQSKAGQPVMNSMEWYRMYKYSESYSQRGVVSEMIWGCQWDAMMRFIGSRATVVGNVSHDLDEPYSTGGTGYTGSITYNDIASNIYDLEGNVCEWTQEARNTELRVDRGR